MLRSIPLIATILLAGLAIASPAFAAPPPDSSLKSLEATTKAEIVRRVLIDRTLKRRAAQDVVLEDAVIRFRDPAGRMGNIPRENVLAILPPEDLTEASALATPAGIVWREITDVRAEARGRIELADGQLFPGRIADGTPRPGTDTVSWVHPLMGRMDFRLDAVSIILISRQGSNQLLSLGPSSGDVVGLTNRDRVEGFVARIGAEIEVEVGTAHKPASFPIERVSYIRFAANTKATPVTGPRVWFHDGTVAAATAITSDTPETLALKIPAAGEATVRLGAGEIVAIALDTTKIRALASIPAMDSPAAAGDRVFVHLMVGDGFIECVIAPVGFRLEAAHRSLHVGKCGGLFVRFMADYGRSRRVNVEFALAAGADDRD